MEGHETRFGNAALCMYLSAELPIVCVTALAPYALSVASWFASSEGSSEALPVHDRRPALVVLLLRDPHLLERRQRRQDRPADPHRVLPLRRRDHLDLHRRRRAVNSFVIRSPMPG